jgi:hypothetical protein
MGLALGVALGLVAVSAARALSSGRQVALR